MNLADFERLIRHRKTAASWVKRAVAELHAVVQDEETHPDVRVALAWEATWLLEVLLDAAQTLAPVVELDEYDHLRELTHELARRLRNLELAPKLERVEGRTPEEAAAFLRKAEELRS